MSPGASCVRNRKAQHLSNSTGGIDSNRLDAEGVTVAAEFVNDTIRTMTGHESLRSFEPTTIPDDAVRAILSAARSAPTSSNLQAFSVILVQDAARKARLSALAGNQRYIEEAPLFFVFCADINRLRYISARQGRKFGADTLEMFLLASIDAALVMQNTVVAAESLGLATAPVGSVRDYPGLIADELQLPQGVFALAGLCVGFESPAARRGIKRRLPQHVTVHRENYSMDTLEQGIAEYDNTMIERRVYAGRQIAVPGEPGLTEQEYGWAEHTALRCSDPESIGASSILGRRDLRDQLERRGFSFG